MDITLVEAYKASTKTRTSFSTSAESLSVVQVTSVKETSSDTMPPKRKSPASTKGKPNTTTAEEDTPTSTTASTGKSSAAADTMSENAKGTKAKAVKRANSASKLTKSDSLVDVDAVAAVTAATTSTNEGAPVKRTASKKEVNISPESITGTPIKAVDGAVVVTSWNVNGLRAAIRKGFFAALPAKPAADMIFLQEVKASEKDLTDFVAEAEKAGYKVHINAGLQAGYAGTALLCKTDSKVKPINIAFDGSLAPDDTSSSSSSFSSLGERKETTSAYFSEVVTAEMTKEMWAVNMEEGRAITVETEKCFFVGSYVPNSGQSLERWKFRTEVWEPAFLAYLLRLQSKKPVLYTGDLNVAHLDIDCHSPSTNQKTAGFTKEERERFGIMLKAGFVDLYRSLYGNDGKAYTYWGYRFGGRENDRGWRLDYYMCSSSIASSVHQVAVGTELVNSSLTDRRSDHAPISIVFTL